MADTEDVVDGGGDPTDDDVVAGAGDGEGGGGDGGGDNPDDGEGAVDLDELAREFEERQLAAAGKAPAAKKDEGKGGSEGAGSSTSERIKNYIDKNYGGDEDAFLAAQYHSREEGKRLADRVRELETKSSSAAPAQTPEQQLKAALDASTEVQSLNREIQDIDAETKTYGARQLEIGKECNAIDVKIAELRGQMAKADSDEKSSIHLEILAKENQKTSLVTEWNSNESVIKTNDRNRRILVRDLQKAQDAVKESMSEKERRERDRATTQQRTRAAFNNAVISQVKEYGLEIQRDAEGKLVFKTPGSRVVYHSVRTQLAEWLDELGDDADTITSAEIGDAVRRLLTSHAEAGFIKKASKSPAPKNKGTGANRPVNFRGSVPPRMPAASNGNGVAGDGGDDNARPASIKEMEKDPDFWRRRAEYLSTGGGRTGVLKRRLS